MSRNFGSRIIREIRDALEPEDDLQDSMPGNEYVTGAAPHPSEGHPREGIPVYPDPLPGAHDYAGKDPVTPQHVPVPPDKPYYSQGMAHGVKSPAHHGGRIAPQHHERRGLETEREPEPEIGHYKIDPIPVYITEPGAGVHPLGQASFRQVTITLGANPVPIAERNPDRISVRILNESAAGGTARLKSGPDSTIGSLLPAAMSSYLEIKTQEQLWAVSDSAATGNAVISVIEEYKIASA